MTNTHLHTWQTTLLYLIDADDAPPAARDDAQHALDTHARAAKLHNEEQHTAHLALQALHTLEREMPAQAWELVQTGKQLNLDTMLRHLDQTTQANTTAQTRARITKNCLTRSETLLTGNCLRPHSDTLLHWIGTRRHAARDKCGPIDTLPAQVQTIYQLLSPTWWNQWDDGLDLNATSRLPLIYSATWERTVRSSMAWVWEQVATGNVQRVPHPANRNPATAAQVLIPTRRFMPTPNAVTQQ